MCHAQLHSVWSKRVLKCFVIPVSWIFDCKGLMSHVPHSAAFGLHQMSVHIFRYFSFFRSSIASHMCRTQLHSVWARCVSKCFVIPVFEVFHCKGLMSHVPHSAAFGLGQMCFKMFRNSIFLRSSTARDSCHMCHAQLHSARTLCFKMFRNSSFLRSSIARDLETAQMRPGLLKSNGLLLPQRLD